MHVVTVPPLVVKAMDEAAQIARTGRILNRCVWAVAGVVMVFSLGTSFTLLREHEVSEFIAWMLAPAVDAALIAALVGDRALHRLGERVVWGTVLRAVAGVMTLGLNTGLSVSRGDWAGVAIHAIAPVLLWVLTEAAQSYQLAFARAASRANHNNHPVSVPNEVVSVPVPVLPANGHEIGGHVVVRPHRETRTQTKAGTGPRPVRPASSRRVEAGELIGPGRAAAAAIEAAGGRLTRDELVKQLRQDGYAVSTGRATELLRRLRDETGDDTTAVVRSGELVAV